MKPPIFRLSKRTGFPKLSLAYEPWQPPVRRVYPHKRPSTFRASPYEKYALNFSVSRVKSFFPNTAKMLLRSYKVIRYGNGPFNSTYFRLNLSFYNKLRIRVYTVSSAIYPNYTGQVQVLNSNMRTAALSKYEPLNLSSEEAIKVMNYTLNNLQRKRFFYTPKADFLNTTFVKVARSNNTKRYDYYKISMLFNASYQSQIILYNFSATLYLNKTRNYLYFSYLGAYRVRPKFFL